jgi:hypothetical protein
MTQGDGAAASVRLIVWCKTCQHQVEPDPAERSKIIWRGDERSRLARPARLLSVRQPRGLCGTYRGQAATRDEELAR